MEWQGRNVVKEQTGAKLQKLRSVHSATIDELDKYKLLVDNVQDYAIFLMDKNGHIITWNKGAEKFKGYKPHEIIGKHFSVFYMPEDISARKPERELEIATQIGRTEDEDWRVRKDGSRFWASVVITALHGPDGHLVGFAKVTRDLTQRKQHEDELRNANSLLRAQQRELQQLNLSKDEFISLASHQLRTPATAIKQLLGLFVEGFESDIADHHLEIIKKAYESNERQITIVNSLLKVAQIDSGKVKLRMEDCNISKMLRDIVSDFFEEIKMRKQDVEVDVADETLSVVADSQHIRMAVENIVSNASKYTYPGGSIRISAAKYKHGRVKITIADSGVGIMASDMETLFEKFRRIPNDLSDEVGGTGLGLYWANRVIGLHGGHIEVSSEPGKGTTFAVYLPVEQ